MCGMAEEKRVRISNLRNETDKRLMITAHRLLCYALKVQYSRSLVADDWASGLQGKPYLKNASRIHFNISHSGSIAMCALHDAPVGIDVEAVKRIDEGVERRFMSEQELAVYDASLDRVSMFYKIWTLKESYVKFCGRGLGTALNHLTVYPDGDRIISNVSGCGFSLVNVIVPGYQAALCAAQPGYSVAWIGHETLESL